jgi:hypothetical protein
MEADDSLSQVIALKCSLRVIGQGLQGFAQACKSRISRQLSLLRIATCCTILRSLWYQSGISPLRIRYTLVPHLLNTSWPHT